MSEKGGINALLLLLRTCVRSHVYIIISRTNLLSLIGRVCVLLTRNQFKLHGFLRL